MQNESAETIAEPLEKRVFCYLRVPECIHTDQGVQFESRLMASGVVERRNRDLGDMLCSMLLGKDKKDWDQLLPQIMRTIRASSRKQTGETANFMMLGRETRLPNTSCTAQQQAGLPLERVRQPG